MEYFTDDEINEERIIYIRNKIEEFFGSLGLSRFSSKIATGYFQAQLQKENGAFKFKRVLNFIHNKITKQKLLNLNPLQCGCPNIFPGLEASPFWDVNDLRIPWAKVLEQNFEIIKSEFLAAKGSSSKPFQPYRAPAPSSSSCQRDSLGYLATDHGDWNVSYLFLHGLDFVDNQLIFPKTTEIIRSFERHYHHAFFSAMASQSHIIPHFGPTNKKLRCQLPLIVPSQEGVVDPCRLIVAGETKVLVEGKCFVFDDSFQHEAFNDCALDSGCPPRVILIVDFWHPDLTDDEVKFLEYINKAQINSAKQIHEYNKNSGSKEAAATENDNDTGGSNFYEIIQNVRQSAADVPDDLIWGNHLVIDD